MKQVTDTGAIEKVVDEIIAKNPDKVADAKSNPKAIGWFVGQVMKSSGGKANPQAVNDILKRKLGLVHRIVLRCERNFLRCWSRIHSCEGEIVVPANRITPNHLAPIRSFLIDFGCP